METKYITITIKPDKPRHRVFGKDSFLLDCAVFGACGMGIYIVTCAVLILGRLV